MNEEDINTLEYLFAIDSTTRQKTFNHCFPKKFLSGTDGCEKILKALHPSLSAFLKQNNYSVTTKRCTTTPFNYRVCQPNGRPVVLHTLFAAAINQYGLGKRYRLLTSQIVYQITNVIPVSWYQKFAFATITMPNGVVLQDVPLSYGDFQLLREI